MDYVAFFKHMNFEYILCNYVFEGNHFEAYIIISRVDVWKCITLITVLNILTAENSLPTRHVSSLQLVIWFFAILFPLILLKHTKDTPGDLERIFPRQHLNHAFLYKSDPCATRVRGFKPG